MKLMTCLGCLSALFTPTAAQDDPSKKARELIEKLSSEQVEEREEAQKKLREMGKAAMPELEKASREANVERAGRAKHLLAVVAISDRLTPAFLKAMPDAPDRLASGDDRHWTAVFLEACEKEADLTAQDFAPLAAAAVRGARSDAEKTSVCTWVWSWQLRPALPELVPLLKDSQSPQASGKAALVLMAADAQEAIPGLLKLLNEKDVRVLAIEILGSVGAQAVAPELLKLIKEDDPATRGIAALALAALNVKEAIPPITGLLKDEDESLRREAAQALGDLGARSAVRNLAALLQDKTPEVRTEALQSLAALGAREEAAPEVARLLSDASADPEERRAAIEVVAVLGLTQESRHLVKLLSEPAAEIRQAAVGVLGRIKAAEAKPDLLPLLKDEDRAIRVAAAEALCRMGVRDGMPTLLQEEESVENLSVANALKEPDLWNRLQQKTVPGRLRGRTNGILKRLAAEVNVTVKDLPPTGENEAWTPTSLREFPVRGARASVAQRLQDTLNERVEPLRGHYEFVLERDQIRFLSRDDAVAFWKAWWAAQRDKR